METEDSEIVPPVEETDDSKKDALEVGAPWWVYLLVVLGILTLAAMAGAIGYYFWKKKQNSNLIPMENTEENPIIKAKPEDPEVGAPLLDTKETGDTKEEKEEKIEA